jgi:cobalt-zinc-cadmium efflux system membrane fusion protein
MKRSSYYAGAIVLILAASCRRADPPADTPPFKIEGDVVELSDAAASSTVTVQSLAPHADRHVSVTGRLVWDENATVRVFPPVSGRVVAIAADLGAWVKKGGRLATLASPDFGQAQADAARAAADLRAADRTLERVRQLLERGAAARKDLDQAEADADRSRAEEARTRTRLKLWGGDRAEMGQVDQAFALASPMSGLVVERNLNPGQEVRSDGTTPLFVVSDPHRLWVLLDITEKDLAEVRAGSKLTIHAPAFPDQTFQGTLDTLGAALDPVTRTIHARGRVDNADSLLKAEMYVSVDVHDHASTPELAVPARAVVEDGAHRFLFVEEKPGTYRRTAVSLGQEQDGWVPVLAGVSGQARIVTEGSLLLESAWAGERQS